MAGRMSRASRSLNPNAKPTTSMFRKRLGSRLAETVALSFFNIAIRQLESSFRPPSFNNFLHKFLRRSLVIRVNEYFGRPQLFCLHTIGDFMLLQRPANGAHRADILAGPDQPWRPLLPVGSSAAPRSSDKR